MKVTLCPVQMEVPKLEAIETDGVTVELIVKAAELVPVTAGFEDTTLTLYPAPVGVPPGIVQEIVPELAVELNVPILVGEAKLPEASES